jgi:hypothetical protein
MANYYVESEAAFEHISDEFMAIYDFARLLRTEVGFEHTFDIGPTNVMKRGKQLVFIDPICNSRDLKLSREILKLDNLFDDAREMPV